MGKGRPLHCFQPTVSYSNPRTLISCHVFSQSRKGTNNAKLRPCLTTIASSPLPCKQKRLNDKIFRAPKQKDRLRVPANPASSSPFSPALQESLLLRFPNYQREVMSRSVWKLPRVSKLIIPPDNVLLLFMCPTEKISFILQLNFHCSGWL